VAIDLEGELSGAILGNIGNLGLCSGQLLVLDMLSCWRTYQVEDASGGGLVLRTLGEEKQTLAGHGGPSSGSRRALLTEEGGQVLGFDRLLTEVEVTLREAQTPENAIQISTILRPVFYLLVDLLHQSRSLVTQHSIGSGSDLGGLLLGGLSGGFRSLSRGGFGGLSRSFLGSFDGSSLGSNRLDDGNHRGSDHGGLLDRLSLRHLVWLRLEIDIKIRSELAESCRNAGCTRRRCENWGITIDGYLGGVSQQEAKTKRRVSTRLKRLGVSQRKEEACKRLKS
jgi:hypothetical protein